MENKDKIDRIFDSVDSKDLLAWMRVHAYVDDKFALALLDKFWQPDSEDLKSIVERCFMHSSYLRDKNYNWLAIEEDMAQLMPKVEKAVEEDDIVKAAYLAGYIIIFSCEAYHKDYYSQFQEQRRPLIDCVRRAVEAPKGLSLCGRMGGESGEVFPYRTSGSRQSVGADAQQFAWLRPGRPVGSVLPAQTQLL